MFDAGVSFGLSCSGDVVVAGCGVAASGGAGGAGGAGGSDFGTNIDATLLACCNAFIDSLAYLWLTRGSEWPSSTWTSYKLLPPASNISANW